MWYTTSTMYLAEKLVEVKREGIILEHRPDGFDSLAVLNPACVQEGETVHMFYRGVVAGNLSSIGYARLEGPMRVVERPAEPLMRPLEAYDCHGTEDPRVVFFEGEYHMLYAAYDGKNARIAHATSTDLKQWTKKGIVSPQLTYREAGPLFQKSELKESYYRFAEYLRSRQGNGVKIWDKDAFIFPRRINGKIAMVHRILPDIQIAYADNFEDFHQTDYWKEYLSHLQEYVLLENEHSFENRNIGGGCPMVETDAGWIMIYHAVNEQNKSKVYSAAVALLDKENPQTVIARARVPLFTPQEKWEVYGSVNTVIFPTGTSQFGDRLYLYYGAADSRIAAASVSLSELVHALTPP